MPPMTGRVIAGRYNLQHPIGRGAMGVVWRARDQILDRDVAVKEVVISSLLGEEERRNAYQRTLREARTAARLSHRGLVAVYDVAEDDGRPWIIMELVPSRSLDQVLTVEGRLPALRVARIGQQLLSALAAAHIAGVLHRDVKPSNVLIATDRTGTGWDERAVLTDFGIAQFEGDPRLTQTGMVMGSPGFTAPERIRGGDATPASDLWSLGATLYAAVEGRGPYEQRGGAITTMSAIINEDAPVAAHAGRLAPVIEALMRRDPASRPTAPAAARMFAYVLPLLSAAEPEQSAPAHPPTAASQAQPSARAVAPAPGHPPDAAPASSGRPKPEAARELAAAARPAAIAPPAPAVAATTPEHRAPEAALSPEAAAAPEAAPAAKAAAAPKAAPKAALAAEAAEEPGPADNPVPEPTAEPSLGAEAAGKKKTEAGRSGAAREAEDAGNAASADNGAAAGPEANADGAGDATPTPGLKAAAAAEAHAQAEADATADGQADAKTEPTAKAKPAAEAQSAVKAESAAKAEFAADADAEATAVGRGDAAADVTAEPAADVTAEPAADVTAEPADDEAVSAVDAVSAVEALQPPADGENADAPTADAVASAGRVAASAGAAQAGPDDSVIDPDPTRPRLQPKSKPKPAPTFTAARPGERPAAPTFSAARPDQAGAAQRTPKAASGSAKSSVAAAGAPSYWPTPPGAASPAGQWSAGTPAEGPIPQYGSAYAGAAASAPSADNQYAGPSKQYGDLAAQYAPAPVNGSGQRRRGSRRWIILAICAVLVAAAIGAGTALALRHHNAASGAGTTAVVQGATPKTAFGSVNALNERSTAVPAGWTAETVTPSQDNTTAGFTIDVPPGWAEKAKGLATYFYGPDDEVLDVDLSPHTYPGNMVQEAQYLQQQQAVVGDAFPGYQRVQLVAVPVRGTHAAFWQFTWSLKNVRVRTDDILFVLPTSAGRQSYAIYMRAPDSGWNSTYLPMFEKIMPTFEPDTTS